MKITDVEPQKKNKDRVSVFVDGEYSFSLDSADALRLGVKAGVEITEKEIEVYNLESNLSKAKAKAFDIVARKMVTEHELRTKLADKGYDNVICDIVIDTMQEYNYINDYDYCLAYFEYGASKGWGKLKIRSELKRKGVADAVLSDAFLEFEDSPEERVFDILERKFSDTDLFDFKQRQRVFRFFASRGFDFDSINSAVDKFIAKNGMKG